MIKDVFVFKKDAWHLKLVKNVWGYNHTDFRNMCPYFWLTVFTVFTSPLIYTIKANHFICLQVIKFIVPPLIKLSDYVDERSKHKLDEWCEQYMTTILNDKNEYNKFIKMDLKTNCKYRKFFNEFLWSSNPDKWELHEKIEKDKDIYQNNTYIQTQNIKREKYIVKSQKINTIKQTSAQNINNIVQAIKPATMFLMYAIGAFIGCFILFWLYLGIVWLTTLDWYGISYATLNVLKYLLMFIVLALILRGLWIMLGGLAKWMCMNITMSSIDLSFIPDFFNWLGNIIIKPLKWLVNGIIILVEIAIAFKKNNCPGLKWED